MVPAAQWKLLHQALSMKYPLTPKEIGIFNTAMQIPAKIPTKR